MDNLRAGWRAAWATADQVRAVGKEIAVGAETRVDRLRTEGALKLLPSARMVGQSRG